MTAIRQSTRALEILVAPRAEGGVLVTVRGDLDVFSIDYLAVHIGDLLGQAPPAAIDLDLAGVEFIDAAAVGRLSQLHQLSAGAGCVLSIGAATQFVWWLLAAAGLAATFPIPRKYRLASEPGS